MNTLLPEWKVLLIEKMVKKKTTTNIQRGKNSSQSDMRKKERERERGRRRDREREREC